MRISYLSSEVTLNGRPNPARTQERLIYSCLLMRTEIDCAYGRRVDAIELRRGEEKARLSQGLQRNSTLLLSRIRLTKA